MSKCSNILRSRQAKLLLSILVDENTRVLVQDLGREGSFHAQQAIKFGTKVVGAVKPGKGGAKQDDIPLFHSVAEAKGAVNANLSVIFAPPPFAADAIMEAADAGIALVICITEGIPTFDMVRACAFLKTTKTRLTGPHCPGIISPGQCKIGMESTLPKLRVSISTGSPERKL